MGNKQSLINLLVILLDNAIKYSHDNSSVVVTTNKSKDYMEIAVKDNGVGINKKDLPHIFDRFYRSDTARTKTGASGYGLGLSIAKKIAVAQDGTILVTSSPKTGSVFTVRLQL